MTRNTIIIFTLILLFTGFTAAKVPTSINYSGYLTNSEGDPVNGDLSILFTIYDAPISGNSVWTETQDINITDGSFTVILGSINPIFDTVFNEATRYLGITVGSELEMTPRIALVSVPYSLRTSTIEGATGGIIYGPLEVVVADLTSIGNAIVVSDTLGHIQLTITASEDGNARLDIYDPLDSKGGFAALNDPKIRISKDGITMFGTTISDTTLLAFPNGDIISTGQIAVGANSSASGKGATVFGDNNTANDTSAVVGGGYYNSADGAFSVISGGNANISGGWASSIGGGTNNSASGISSTIAGGRYNATIGYSSFIGGGISDTANGEYATIGGGGNNFAGGDFSVIGGGLSNEALDNYSAVCGGYNNSATELSYVGGGQHNLVSGTLVTIGGGQSNSATGFGVTIGGGSENTASGDVSTIAGGVLNTAGGASSSIGGGVWNNASGISAVIPGGSYCNAGGDYSFAAGRRAKANNTGSFVFGDSFNGDVTSANNNEFTIRMAGGYRFYTNTSLTAGVTLAPGGGSWASVSDSTLKENITSVDGEEILEKISELEISRWNYESQDASIQHIGPMAQDFYRLFGLGEDDKHINTLDPDGIALAAIKALIEKNAELNQKYQELLERTIKLELIIEQLNK